MGRREEHVLVVHKLPPFLSLQHHEQNQKQSLVYREAANFLLILAGVRKL